MAEALKQTYEKPQIDEALIMEFIKKLEEIEVKAKEHSNLIAKKQGLSSLPGEPICYAMFNVGTTAYSFKGAIASLRELKDTKNFDPYVHGEILKFFRAFEKDRNILGDHGENRERKTDKPTGSSIPAFNKAKEWYEELGGEWI